MESLFLPTLCPPHHFTDFLNNLLDAEANMPWFFFFFYLIPLQAEEGQDWMRRSSRRVSWERNPTSIHENMGSIPGLAQWVKDCGELCRSQTWLGSGIAVAVISASGCSSYSTPSLGTSICCSCGPKNIFKKLN